MRSFLEKYIEPYRQEAYQYFHDNVRKLPKNKNGNFDESTGAMSNNDADAFRHAFVSGVMTLKWGATNAEIMGFGVELVGKNPKNERNMDLWNNAIGRKYAKVSKTNKDLAMFLLESLKNEELIVKPSDARKYKGLLSLENSPPAQVLVIQESETGRNELFFDTGSKEILNTLEFVNAIKAGIYPNYKIATINGKETPMSKADGILENNLG